MRTRETELIIHHPHWHAWQRLVRLGETSLGLEEYALRSTQDGPTDPPSRYTLDEQGLRRFYSRLAADDDMPYLSSEHPARSIDEIVADSTPYITGGPGQITIFPLIYDGGDADGLLISVGDLGTGPRIVGPMDWDDVADRRLDEALTIEEIITIVNNVIREANRGLALG